MPPHLPVWTLSALQVYETLDSSAKGLSETETAARIKQYGFNELPEPARRSLLLRFTDQLTHFMALLLWAAGALAFASGTPELGWAVWAVIWINAGFSFWQEFQAEQALAALNKMLPAQTKVYRGGVNAHSGHYLYPPLQKVFTVAPLLPLQWSMLMLCPPLILTADEIRKRIVHEMWFPIYQLQKLQKTG